MIAALFVTRGSIYKSLPGVDCYDITSDARSYSGPFSVVAHPPCRSWGKLRHFSKPRDDERELAFFAIDKVRTFGGVLEHPVGSELWRVASLPRPGKQDSFGGFTLGVNQSWWGHRAEKATLLYICGVSPRGIPLLPLCLDYPYTTVENMGRPERERTPLLFATWLVELACLCQSEVR